MTELRFTVDRTAPRPDVATGDFRAGAAERDITPPFGLPLAGYSLGGKLAHGVWGRLFARALLFEDELGRRACLVVCDLMSGTRALLEKVAARTAPVSGISVDRLLLAGTHTHNGPAGIYGNSFYDTFAHKLGHAGSEPELLDWLANRIALTVEEAAQRLEPATVASGSAPLWGRSKNRSMGAFSRPGWSDPGSGTPAEGAPAGLAERQKAIDPRVRVLAACRRTDGAPLAAFAFWGCHYHATGVKTRLYTSDAAGCAVRQARWRLESAFTASRPVVALGAGGAADVNTMRNGLADFQPLGLPLARWVGNALGDVVADVTVAIAPGAVPRSMRTRFREPDHSEPAPGGSADARLASSWVFGAPVLAGSEETPTVFRGALAREGMRCDDFAPSHPQHPKCVALGPFQAVLEDFLDLAPCPVYPLHQLRIDDLVLVAVPGEITTVGAWELERAVRDAAQADDVIVVGYCDDYGGYVTTDAEFRKQHYEGASTLYGRNVARYLEAFHVEMATAAAAPPPSGGVEFVTCRGESRFSPGSRTFAHPDPEPRVRTRPSKRIAALTWRMHRDTHLVLASEGPLVRLEEEVAGQWRAFEHKGRVLDDYWHGISVKRRLDGRRWRATLHVPDAALGRTLRFVLVPRSDFPGAVSVPFSIPS